MAGRSAGDRASSGCVKALFLVALGGAAGAVLRHLAGAGVTSIVGRSVPTDGQFQPFTWGSMPWSTLLVNVVGSFVLGALVTWVARTEASPDIKLLVGTGLCGALTTFSTFSVETLSLVQSGHRAAAIANLALNVVLGLSAAALGIWALR